MCNSSLLISRYLAGSSTPAERAELQEWIKAQPSNATEFAAQAFVEHSIRELYSSRVPISDSAKEEVTVLTSTSPTTSSVGNAESPQQSISFRYKLWGFGGLAAAATILLAMTLGPPANESSARLALAHDAVWSSSQVPVSSRVELDKSLELESGMARIDFDSGAQVVLRGPARFEIADRKKLILLEGNLLALCPTKETHGFTVHVPNGRIVDLGTEFLVEVSAAGDMNARVFEGEVQVFLDVFEKGNSSVLRKGDSLSFEAASGRVNSGTGSPEVHHRLSELLDRSSVEN